MSRKLVALPASGRSMDATARTWAGVGVLVAVAVVMILVGGPQGREDPLAARITAALRTQCGPGLQVLRTEGARGVYAGPNAVPFRCNVFVDGNRAGQGTGYVDLNAGRWSLFYEFADRHGEAPGTHCVGNVSGLLSQGMTATAQAD